MTVDLRRLRAGELLTAAAAALMIIALLALPWTRATGGRVARDGWTGTAALHWLLTLVVLAGLAAVITQASCRAPAIPASLDVVSTAVALVALTWLLIRVAIHAGGGEQAGVWLELAGTCGLAAGSFLSLRQEGILERDGPQEIPVVALEDSLLAQ